jgi:Peptidase M50B-like
MPKVIADITMSLDGFVTGKGAGERYGLGDAPELLTLIRRSFGTISVPAAIALLAAVGRCAHHGLEEVTVYAMTWMLLLSGARTAVAHGKWAGDAGTLSMLTPLPRRFWSLLWIAGTLLAVAIGGKWLVLRS